MDSTTIINQFALCKPIKRTKKGVKGFSKIDTPKDTRIAVRLKTQTNKFIEDYCTINGITKTQLILASIQNFTGYDGSNGRKVLSEIKSGIDNKKLV